MKKGIGFWFRRVSVLPMLGMLAACQEGILNPQGPIGEEEKTLLVICVAAMLLIVVPTIIFSVIFGLHYREKNVKAGKAKYDPKWAHSNIIEVGVWGIPIIMIVFLGVLTWKTTHSLDPYKPLSPTMAGDVKPLEVEVVAMDWKWLFIYPDQGIAVVNQLAIPVNTPINFRITSDSVMNSFFIPQLGSMVYAMAGMQTQLHLLARHEGDYLGESTNYSGRGFSDMNFRTLAMSNENFAQWVEKVKNSPDDLNEKNYKALVAPSEKNPVAYYAHVNAGMFDSIIAKYNNGQARDGKKIINVHSSMSDM